MESRKREINKKKVKRRGGEWEGERKKGKGIGERRGYTY